MARSMRWTERRLTSLSFFGLAVLGLLAFFCQTGNAKPSGPAVISNDDDELPQGVMYSMPLVKRTERMPNIHKLIASARKTGGIFRPRPVLARLLKKFAGTPTIDLPMGGNIWPVGGFYTKIYVGTPPQPQLVQIDTGSSDLLVAEKGCVGCPNSVQYDPSSSTTSVTAPCSSTAFRCAFCENGSSGRCGFNNTYQTCDYADPSAECSLLGWTYFDIFTVEDNNFAPSVNIGFGGISAHAGAPDNEWTNMPGVMGMAYPGLAGVWLKNTPFDSLVNSGQMANVFAMCLAPQGGVMTLGGIDQSLYTGPIQWTPIKAELWYVLNITDVSVNGRTLGLPSQMYNQIGGGTILDSGTNTFVVNSEAYDIIFARFIDYCTTAPLVGICDVPANLTIFHPGTCFHMQQADIDAYPPVSVTLEGTGPLTLHGRDYLIPHPELDGRYCMGIQPSGVGGFTILGNVFQNPFYTIFDRANKRLGFAQSSNCGGSL